MRIKGLILFIIVAGTAVFAAEQTWHLSGGQEWQQVSQESGGDFMMAVAEAKQLVSTGKVNQAKKAFAKLKKDYPQIAGDDFDAFVKAELLYGQRKYVAASNAYDQFAEQFPESAFYQSALERQQQIATAFLAGQKRRVLKVFSISAYDEGGEIMNKIADRAGDAPIAQNALKTLAMSREKRGVYHEAYLTWADVSNRWPTGQVGKEALLGMARSLEKDYRGPKFDSKMLESSKSYYAEYQKRYPDAAAEIEVPQTLNRIDEKLAQKELAVGDYYARTSSIVAANLYYQRIVNDWPNSSAGKTAGQKLPEIKKELDKKAQQQSSKKKKINWKGLFL
jgi:outer membrane protein assembly factor BamD (BamD/ComL family)